MTVILTVRWALPLFLSIFLVVNTINVLLSQHVRQIGIMKAIGGRLEQLFGMYLVLIMSFGVLALVIAIPLGAFAAYATSGFMAGFLNFKLQGFRIVPSAILLQVITGMGVPLAAGLVASTACAYQYVRRSAAMASTVRKRRLRVKRSTRWMLWSPGYFRGPFSFRSTILSGAKGVCF